VCRRARFNICFELCKGAVSLLVGNSAMGAALRSAVPEVLTQIMGFLLLPSEMQRWSAVNRTSARMLSTAATWSVASYDVSASCRCRRLCTARAVRVLLQQSGDVYALQVRRQNSMVLNTAHRSFKPTQVLESSAFTWMLQGRAACLTSCRLTLPNGLFGKGVRIAIGIANSTRVGDVFQAQELGLGPVDVWCFTGPLHTDAPAASWKMCCTNAEFDVYVLHAPVLSGSCVVTFTCERNKVSLYVDGRLCLYVNLPLPWPMLQTTFDVRSGPWYFYVSLHHPMYRLPAAIERVVLQVLSTCTTEFYGHWRELLDGLALDVDSGFERPVVGGGH
jgi:hypothetical protein